MSVSRPRRAGAGGDNGEIGDRAIGHRLLHAIEAAAGRESLIACGDGLPLPSNSASVPIASPDGNQGKPFLLLRLAAGEQNGFGGQIDRGGKRHRRQRAAHFLGDHAELEMAGTGAADIASGIATPRKPISARPFHNSRS